MKLILQIAAGIILGGGTLYVLDTAINYYQAQAVLKELQEFGQRTIKAPTELRDTTLTRTIESKTKEQCLTISGNKYNDVYLKCRQGQILTIRRDGKTGKETVIRSEPLVKNGGIEWKGDESTDPGRSPRHPEIDETG